MRRDFIVIGGGASGMSAALLLARHGRSVALVEKCDRLAPTLRGFFRQGVFFDTGLHYTGSFAPGEMLDRYFRHLGLEGLAREPYDPEAFDLIRYPDKGCEFPFPYGYERISKALRDRFPREAAAIETYLRDVRADFESSPFLNLNRPFRTDDLAPADTRTLAGYLDALTNDTGLKSVLSMHCLLYGVPPCRTPFASHAKIVGSYYQSVHGIDGGGLAVARAFEGALRTAGVEICCGSGVREIALTPDGSTAGVILENGERIDAAGIVCTTHPRVMLDLVPSGSLRPIYAERIRKLTETPSAFMLFGIADTPLPELAGRNLFLCPEDDVASFFRPGRAPHEGPFYVAGSLSRDGRQAVVAIAPGDAAEFGPWADSATGRRPEAYLQRKRERLDAMREALLRLAPELSAVRFIDGATPLTLRDYMHNPTGSLYGPAHTSDQFNPVPGTRIPGLLLAGQSVVAPGLLGAVVSAYLTCGFIIGHDTLRKELSTCV